VGAHPTGDVSQYPPAGGAAGRAPIAWRVATVREARMEAPGVRTLVLDVPGWPGHMAGQHVDVRLTAEDGYQAQRSYSIASAPESAELELTVEELEDGEVSPYLVEDVGVGDRFELRGPIGGYFTWDVSIGGPLLLVAGGSGIVPLMAMIRHRRAAGSDAEVRLLLSAKTRADIIYRAELEASGVPLHVTLTRAAPAGWTGDTRRIDLDMLRAVGPDPARAPHVYVCGPTPFVEEAAGLLVALGHPPAAVRTERFGNTGG
jgi:ferredoxin-NADP reductase